VRVGRPEQAGGGGANVAAAGSLVELRQGAKLLGIDGGANARAATTVRQASRWQQADQGVDGGKRGFEAAAAARADGLLERQRQRARGAGEWGDGAHAGDALVSRPHHGQLAPLLARGGGDGGGGSSGGSSGGDSWVPTVRPHRPSVFPSTDCRVGSCAARPTRPPSAGSQAAVARGDASTAHPLRGGAD
jgi:hypothetical protein